MRQGVRTTSALGVVKCHQKSNPTLDPDPNVGIFWRGANYGVIPLSNILPRFL